MKKLEKLGFKKIPTEPGFHMYELAPAKLELDEKLNNKVRKKTFKNNKVPKRIKHNDLTHYFLRQHSELPRAYLASCEKFFNSLKQQAPSSKPQATSVKLDKSK
jgi:hypothetical protein